MNFPGKKEKRILENLYQQGSPDIIAYNPISALGTTYLVRRSVKEELPIFWYIASLKSNLSKNKNLPIRRWQWILPLGSLLSSTKRLINWYRIILKKQYWQILHQPYTNSLRRKTRGNASQLLLWGQHNLDNKHWQKHYENWKLQANLPQDHNAKS